MKGIKRKSIDIEIEILERIDKYIKKENKKLDYYSKHLTFKQFILDLIDDFFEMEKDNLPKDITNTNIEIVKKQEELKLEYSLYWDDILEKAGIDHANIEKYNPKLIIQKLKPFFIDLCFQLNKALGG